MDEPPTPHTYEQAAAALGIQPEAVRARLRRGALRRGPLTNDRRPTVLLSPAEIATIRAGVRTQPAESEADSGPDSAGRPDERDRTIAALEAEAAALRDALGRERERADRVEANRDAARALADQRGREVVELRERVGQAEGESGALREQAKAERDRAAALAAERDAARSEREAAKVAAALAEGEARGLRLALERAERPFWKRWLGA